MGKAPSLAGGTATSQIEGQGSVLLAFFFFPFWSEGIGESSQLSLCIMCTRVKYLASGRLTALLGDAD